jgi:tRNA/tmRNA/rRNA uracil-C5-methylase (TrmA/RlmC/RlmD family)
MAAGDLVELPIEKPAAGGRMLARLDGQVILVSGAIPGERVRARLEGRRGGVLLASTAEVLESSPDRQEPGADPACGGRSFAHITPARQRSLKVEIVRDALRRLGKLELPFDVAVHGSPDAGYRMRARLHLSGSAIGFYREGTHTLCDPACSRQLRSDTLDVLQAISALLARAGIERGRSLELSENREATCRAAMLDLDGSAPRELEALLDVEGLTGFGVARGGRPLAAAGSPVVTDELTIDHEGRHATLRLDRHVTSFFQSNRFLLQTLVERVLSQIPDGPVTDLYAGVGLFGLAHAALDRGDVLAVESDPRGADDLQSNAEPFAGRVRVEARAVEDVLARRAAVDGRSVVVDPPRTGLSRQALGALATARPVTLVYVSCDVGTLARDLGTLVGAGYVLETVELFDLFPGTAHVETMARLTRPFDPQGV